MSQSFIVIKVNLDLLNPILLHVVYTVDIFILNKYINDYLSEVTVSRKDT